MTTIFFFFFPFLRFSFTFSTFSHLFHFMNFLIELTTEMIEITANAATCLIKPIVCLWLSRTNAKERLTPCRSELLFEIIPTDRSVIANELLASITAVATMRLSGAICCKGLFRHFDWERTRSYWYGRHLVAKIFISASANGFIVNDSRVLSSWWCPRHDSRGKMMVVRQSWQSLFMDVLGTKWAGVESITFNVSWVVLNTHWGISRWKHARRWSFEGSYEIYWYFDFDSYNIELNSI